MTERILQHSRPADAQFSIKRCLEDEWIRIPGWQKGFKCCLDCGLPTMRLVYQESEIYTMLCMACGKAHRYYANSCAKAEQIYDRIDADDYKRAQHAVGLDYHNKPTGRNYFTTNGENPFKTLPSDCYDSKNNCYWLTPYGYRLLGFDDMGDDKYLKILW